MPNLGISFSPLSDNSTPTNPREPAPTPQEAIRVLSLRVPRTVGAGSPIPQGLLNAPGGAAFGGGGVNLEQLLAMLFGRKGGAQTPGLPIEDSPGGSPTGGTFPPSQPPAPTPPSPKPPPPGVTVVQPPTPPNPWEQQTPPNVGPPPPFGAGERRRA